MQEDQFIKTLAQKNIHLKKRQIEQFSAYYDLLVEWNDKINLTSITKKEDVYLKHFFDSITPAMYIDLTRDLSICDVGAGAGFPSIPLKICFPHLKITIIDSLKKRINFLSHLTEKLQLENVSFYHHRAEDFGQLEDYREKYDIVLARAVARMSVLSEYCLPLTKRDGQFIALKGSQAEEELEIAHKAIHRLGGKINQNYVFTLPYEDSERSIIIIDKVKQTPKKFPRKAGTPNKHPLQ